MAKYRLCPEYCLFDPEGDIAQYTCSECSHAQDVFFDPPRDGILSIGKNEESVTVIAVNGNFYWIECRMSNGNTYRSTVDRDKVRFV